MGVGKYFRLMNLLREQRIKIFSFKAQVLHTLEKRTRVKKILIGNSKA